jgi:hypothetical protein
MHRVRPLIAGYLLPVAACVVSLLAPSCSGDEFSPTVSPSAGNGGASAGGAGAAGNTTAGTTADGGKGGSTAGNGGSDPAGGGGSDAGSAGNAAAGNGTAGAAGEAAGAAGEEAAGAAGVDSAGAAGTAGAEQGGNAGEGGSGPTCEVEAPDDAIFVSADGADGSGAGTAAKPFASLSAAASAITVKAGSVTFVVAKGTLKADATTVTLPAGVAVTIEGGFTKTGATWTRDCAAARGDTLVQLTNAKGIDASGALTLKRISIAQSVTAPPTAPATSGGSTYGIVAKGTLVLDDTDLQAGSAAPGGTATAPPPPSDPSPTCRRPKEDCKTGAKGADGAAAEASKGWAFAPDGTFLPGDGNIGGTGLVGETGTPSPTVEARRSHCGMGCNVTTNEEACTKSYSPVGANGAAAPDVVGSPGFCGCGGVGSPGGGGGLGGGTSVGVLALGGSVTLIDSRVTAGDGGAGTPGATVPTEGTKGTNGAVGTVSGGFNNAGCCLATVTGCNWDSNALTCSFKARPLDTMGVPAACAAGDTLIPNIAGGVGGKGGKGADGSAGVGGPSIGIAYAGTTSIEKSGTSAILAGKNGETPGKPTEAGLETFQLP